MTEHRIHHPKACTERLYLPRSTGGRGLADLNILHRRQVNQLKKFFHRKKDTSTLHKLACQSDRYLAVDLRKNEIKEIPTLDEVKEKWLSKRLHGKYPSSLKTAGSESTNWLVKGQLFAETEGFITAIQDESIATRNYKKYVQKIRIDDDKCRMCGRVPETIEHVTAGCQTLAPSEYTKRHNLTANIVHQELAMLCNLGEGKYSPYFKYIPAPVLENENYRLYWDTPIVTDKPIASNRPEIILLDKANKKAYFIDISHPSDHNLEQKEREKINKYYDLAEEYKKILTLKAVHVIPVIISATGLVTKKFAGYLERLNITNKTIVTKMQKSVILETCKMVRKTLNIPET
ncbi:uncharacterized protein LOC132697066 [Cylas formicarius]|uniref:uncharacterized protein LOC132697066 n=1 Tax=Cylas formicarius TaxID=197179 RepID=UPI0029589722|nr:uncharacterized protein LOC132697066 [Cylas formicarius]